MKCRMISMKARPTRNPPSAWLRLDWFVSADNAHALQPRALFQEYEVQLGGTREIIRCKRPQRLSHGRLRRLTAKFSASCGQFFVVVRSERASWAPGPQQH